MTERRPYDAALQAINELNTQINGIVSRPDGGPRPLDGQMTAAILNVRGRLAIASALLAIADALKGNADGSAS
ncbi:hypothetical protein ABZU94_10615 [Streptomyces mirabilis]|uniref:hypothetical protein n=1 Tax=Streptomyces sp. NPDC005388 TaxID=3156717 RepID=UPI0033A319BF